MNKFFSVIIISIFFFSNSISNDNNEIVTKISKNLRCLICQGQSVYDSQSDFALSIKIFIKKNLNEGKSEDEIYNSLKQKYGEWIVYEPKINKYTYVLWLFPLILFIFGGLLILRKAFIK